MTLTPRFIFGNIVGVETVSFTLSRGVTPGVCSVRLPANDSLMRGPATMYWSDGVRSAAFENCVVNDVSYEFSGDGGQVMLVAILDRRWRWQNYGQITGVYNVRTGAAIQKGTRKTIRELVQLCFASLGETNYDVSLVPEDVFPFVDWDMEKPAAVLQELLEQVNCHLCLGCDDVIRIWPDGMGPDMPDVPSSSSGIGVEYGTRPGAVGIASGWMKWQVDLELEPVGEDEVGAIRPLSELTYMAEGIGAWDSVMPDSAIGAVAVYREAVKKWLWRWFRVKCIWSIEQMPKTGESPNADLRVDTPSQLWPLLDTQLEVVPLAQSDAWRQPDNDSSYDDLDAKRRWPAVAWGVFCNEYGTDDNIPIDDFNETQWYNINEVETDSQGRQVRKNERLICKTDFVFNHDRQLVVFEDPVYRVVDSKVAEPILRLRTAVHFRDAVTRGAYRRFVSLDAGGPDNSLVEWTTREDVVPEWKQTGYGHVGEDNLAEVGQFLNYYLQFSARKYLEGRLPANMEVPWLELASPNGRIAQVTFQIDGAGFMSTSIHRELEDLSTPVSYKERKRELARLAQEDRLRKFGNTGKQDSTQHGVQ